MVKKAYIGVLLLLGIPMVLACGAVRADTVDEGEDQAEAIRSLTLVAAHEVRKMLGDNYRIAAELEICHLEGLARLVVPKPEKVAKALQAYLAREPEAEQYQEEVFEALQAHLAGYLQGQKEASELRYFEFDTERREEFCNQAIWSADWLLESASTS